MRAGEGLMPGVYLVDAFPLRMLVLSSSSHAFLIHRLVKHVPEWLPGAGFKRKANNWGKMMRDSVSVPFELVCKAFVRNRCHFRIISLRVTQGAGTAAPSFTSTWLSKISHVPEGPERERLLYWMQSVSGTAFLAGYETVITTIMALWTPLMTITDLRITHELRHTHASEPRSPS